MPGKRKDSSYFSANTKIIADTIKPTIKIFIVYILFALSSLRSKTAQMQDGARLQARHTFQYIERSSHSCIAADGRFSA